MYSISKNKGIDQLHGYRAVDRCLCFCICVSSYCVNTVIFMHKPLKIETVRT